MRVNEVQRLLIENNLRECLRLWLEAIGNGDYTKAKEILEWRVVLRRRLQGGK